MTVWTRQQQILVAILPKIAATFSFLGSTWIIVEVLTHRGHYMDVGGGCTGGSTSTGQQRRIVQQQQQAKRYHPYHRLLLGMSVYDLLESIFNFCSTWPIPSNTPDRVWATGNRLTCTIQGFFLQLGIAIPCYNAFLAMYYMLVINLHYTEQTLIRVVEPSMHLVAAIIGFGTSIPLLPLGYYNEAQLWCWIAPYPTGCYDSIQYGYPPENTNPCTRGDYAWVVRYALYFGPLWLLIISATIFTLMVYNKVRATEKRTVMYRRPETSYATTNYRLVAGRSQLLSIAESLRSSLRLSVNDESSIHDTIGPTEASESFASNNNNNNNNTTRVGNVQQQDQQLDCKTNKPASDDELLKEFKDINDYEKEEDDLLLGNRQQQQQQQTVKTTIQSCNQISSTLQIQCIDDHPPRPTMPGVEERRQNQLDDSRKTVTSSISQQLAYYGTSMRISFNQTRTSVSFMFNNLRRNNNNNTVEQQERQQQSSRVRLHPRSYEVGTQAMLYLIAFYLTHIWSTINRIYQQVSNGKRIFVLTVIHSFFDPFQGMLNFIVYQRPRYMIVRRKHPQLGRWGAIVRVLQFSFLQCQFQKVNNDTKTTTNNDTTTLPLSSTRNNKDNDNNNNNKNNKQEGDASNRVKNKKIYTGNNNNNNFENRRVETVASNDATHQILYSNILTSIAEVCESSMTSILDEINIVQQQYSSSDDDENDDQFIKFVNNTKLESFPANDSCTEISVTLTEEKSEDDYDNIFGNLGVISESTKIDIDSTQYTTNDDHDTNNQNNNTSNDDKDSDKQEVVAVPQNHKEQQSDVRTKIAADSDTSSIISDFVIHELDDMTLVEI